MPWGAYPGDMLMWKARSRAIKSVFPGALRGLQVMQDMQGETIDITPEKPPAATTMDGGAQKLLKGTEGLKAKVRRAKPEGSHPEKAPPPAPPPVSENDTFDAEAWNKHLNALYKERASKTDFRNHLVDAQDQCRDSALLEACKERWNNAMDALDAKA